MKILAFDVGGSFIKYAQTDGSADVTCRGVCPTPQTGRKEFIDTLTEIYKGYPEAEGIAVSLPGIIDSRKGHCLMGGALRYNDDFMLRDALYEKCRTKIVMENDAKCAAIAEASLGALRDVSDGMVILLGTMIGGGLIHDHKVLRGRHFSAGEVSYIMTGSEPRPDLGQYWGNQCSVLELCRLYAEKTGRNPEDIDGRTVFDAWRENVPEAKASVSQYAGNIALQLFSLQTVYDPERIAVGGGISAQEALIDSIRTELEKLYDACPYTIPRAQIVRCAFGNDANLIGAAQCFMSGEYDAG